MHKCRAWTIDTREEDKGWYCEVAGKSYFVSRKLPSITKNGCWAANFVEVDPETVGQFIGIKDKNSKEIYAGDIFGNIPQLRCVVKRENDGAYKLHFLDKIIKPISILDHKISKSEIIGNVTDNPELLEKQ